MDHSKTTGCSATFQDIATALTSTALDEGLRVSELKDITLIRKGTQIMGLVVCGNHDLSFYFSTAHGTTSAGLMIDMQRNKDAALSRGLDFIYS